MIKFGIFIAVALASILAFLIFYPFHLAHKKKANKAKTAISDYLDSNYIDRDISRKIFSVNGDVAVAEIERENKLAVLVLGGDGEVSAREFYAKDLYKYEIITNDKVIAKNGETVSVESVFNSYKKGAVSGDVYCLIKIYFKDGPMRPYHLELANNSAATLMLSDERIKAVIESSMEFFQEIFSKPNPS
ncbi:hypothetical protein [Microbulbifer sp. JMSA003]|uniref:hypothetical protein n=1 Tax=Microbulbifer sp. JMSA003 TaxID=3243369 RepID=UPI004039F926